MTRGEIKMRALAIIEPQLTDMSNKLMTACQALRYVSAFNTERDLQAEAEELTERYIEQQITLASDALHKVVTATRTKISEADLAQLFVELRPPVDKVKSTIYDRFRGVALSVPSHTYAIDVAYERISKVKGAELALIASPTPQPLRSSIITECFAAPDTNVLIHFKHVTQLAAHEIGLDPPIHWLMLEQVITEVDEKAHHRDSYYAKRASQLQKLVSSAIRDASAFGKGSTVTIYFPDKLPELDNLDLAVADHRIIAQAIAFQQENVGAAVTIVSNDLALSVRARQFGLDVVSLPEQLRRTKEDG